MYKSFTGRFFIIYALTTCIMFVLLFFLFTRVISDYFIDGKYEAMLDESRNISKEYISSYVNHTSSEVSFMYQLQIISRKFNSRILIFDQDSQVILDSSNDGSSVLGQIYNNDLLSDAYLGTPVKLTDTFTPLYKDVMLITALPISLNGQVENVVLMLTPYPNLKEDISYIYELTFIAMLIILTVTFISTYVFSNGIANSFKDFSNNVKNIAQGDLSSRVAITSNDEMGELAVNLNHMAEELEKLEDFRKDFIANISHDFRSPLTSIKGYIQAMLDGTIPYERQEKYLNIVLDEADRLTKLTNDILLLTKMENNTIQMNRTDFDLHQVIRKILLQFEKKILDKNIDFTLLIPSQEVYVNADINQIQRVITNLIDNAIKFCRVGDEILVETTLLKSKVEVKIADSGPGISEEDIKYIWDRFHKADRSRGRDKKGIGLGLSIVREIIKEHNENINVYSQEGKGATFVFTLSLSEPNNFSSYI